MARMGVRVVVGAAGATGVLVGSAVLTLGALFSVTMTGTDSWRSATQVVEVPGCSTVVMEIADVQVDSAQLRPLQHISALRDRTQERLIISAEALRGDQLLIGVADRQDIENRLLGSRYCLVETQAGVWVPTAVAVTADAPDVVVDGVAGEWATTSGGRAVTVAVPTSGSSIVVSGSENSVLSAVGIAAEVSMTGGASAGLIAVLGGSATLLLGILLLVISIHTLRARGGHERDSGIGRSI